MVGPYRNAKPKKAFVMSGLCCIDDSLRLRPIDVSNAPRTAWGSDVNILTTKPRRIALQV